MNFDLPHVLWRVLVNPNVTYTLLIFGVWSIIAAIVTPGWGVPEGLAITCLALASVGLLHLPTNVAALLLILAAIPLYTVEIKVKSHGVLALMATFLLTLGSLFLFRSPDEAERVSRGLILIVTLGTLVIVFLFILLIPRAPSDPPSRRIRVGDVGVARTALNPRGVVYIRNEEWTGESRVGPIAEGTSVEVVEIRGLIVYVKPIKALPQETQ